jgi:hypothetical protein
MEKSGLRLKKIALVFFVFVISVFFVLRSLSKTDPEPNHELRRDSRIVASKSIHSKVASFDVDSYSPEEYLAETPNPSVSAFLAFFNATSDSEKLVAARSIQSLLPSDALGFMLEAALKTTSPERFSALLRDCSSKLDCSTLAPLVKLSVFNDLLAKGYTDEASRRLANVFSSNLTSKTSAFLRDIIGRTRNESSSNGANLKWSPADAIAFARIAASKGNGSWEFQSAGRLLESTTLTNCFDTKDLYTEENEMTVAERLLELRSANDYFVEVMSRLPVMTNDLSTSDSEKMQKVLFEEGQIKAWEWLNSNSSKK